MKNRMKKIYKKALTLVEVLISIAITILIFFSILSFKIFLSQYIEYQSIQNNIKSLIATFYYHSQINQNNDLSNTYLNTNYIQKNLNIEKLNIQLINSFQKEINLPQNKKYKIRIETLNVSYKYRGKNRSFSLTLPFITQYIITPRPIIPKPPGSILYPDPGNGADPTPPPTSPNLGNIIQQSKNY